MVDLPDEELMQRYGAGDAAAFEALYRRHRGPLYRFFLRQAGHAGAAEELFQDVWMKVIDSRGRYEVRARFTTWLYTIAHHRLVDHYRAQGRAAWLDGAESEAVLEELPDGALAVEVRLDHKRAVERILSVLGELPDVQREAFLLQHESGLSLEEIAEATGVGRETAKSRLRYAIAKLRASLDGDPESDA
jgi:RNA polymerase sigma factor (sigma-70 family)